MNDKLRCVEYLQELSRISDSLGVDDEFHRHILKLDEMLESEVYKIAIVGEFSAGKSTFINALLGEEVLYSANKEATGVVTQIRSSSEAKAYICSERDDVIDSFSLYDAEGRTRLASYLDINSKKKIGYVNIEYPISGIDESVMFLDTPGIEKMSQAQLLMTADAIRRSNAVLFLIRKEGFTGSGLEVLTGRHEIIGKIPTDNIFVIMTHIGDVYDNYKDASVATEKITELKDKVEKLLLDEGLGNIRVYELDSKEYLWGVSKEAYEEEMALRMTGQRLTTEMLDAKVYYERSRFKDFKNDLLGFLNSGDKNELLLDDVKRKIYILAEALYDMAVRSRSQENKDKVDRVSYLQKQHERVLREQRSIYNGIIRDIDEDFYRADSYIDKDCEETRKVRDTDIYEVINRQFRTVDDINSKNLEICLKKMREKIRDFGKKEEQQINEYIKFIEKDLLPKHFKERFNEVIGDNDIDISIDIPLKQYETKFSETNEDYSVDDADILELTNKRNEKEYELKIDRKELNSLENEINNLSAKIDKTKRTVETWYKAEIKAEGSRPKPVQKYRTVHETKGFWIFKKTNTYQVTDGMDDSKGKAWDKKMKLLQTMYEQKTDEVDKEEEKRDRLDARRRECSRRISRLQDGIRRLDDELSLRKKDIEEEIEKYKDQYLSQKKENVLSRCSTLKYDMLEQIATQAKSHLYTVRKSIRDDADRVIKMTMSEYEKKLKTESERLCGEQVIKIETYDEFLHMLKKIMEEISNE